MRNLKILGLVLFLAVSMLSGISCINKKAYDSPTGYDLNTPVKYNMPEKLTEISGIAFKNGKADSLYAEEDEKGRVYYFKLGNKAINHSAFAKDGDYEDIAILGQQTILLRSDGTFFTFLFNGLRSGDINNVKKQNGLLPKGEYEGLYADEKTTQLYALCKHCDIDNIAKTNSGYIFKQSLDGQLVQSGQFSINVREIEALVGKKKVAFHPSALAKNQLTNEWYILSSVNKVLVVADTNWKVKQVYPLNPSLFMQPEGMAFDARHNLYISNEGDEISPGNVLKFIYKK